VGHQKGAAQDIGEYDAPTYGHSFQAQPPINRHTDEGILMRGEGSVQE